VGNPFSIGIILAYFILKKNELRKIMTILNAKVYMLQPEEIKSRL
jgi:vacuolar-type H+-ATPase subunit C/Vma6